MQNNVATIGDNLPPNDAEVLQQTLKENHNVIFTRAQELVEAGDRIPAEINDEETAKKATAYISQVNAATKTVESLRETEKSPYLTLGRVVDGVFNTVKESLAASKSKALKPLDAYNKKVEAENRRKLAEEARLKREKEDEERLAQDALRRANQTEAADKMGDQANISANVAAEAERAAEAKPCELVKTRADTGAVSSLRTEWRGEVVDLETINLEILRHHFAPADIQKALNSFVRAGGRELMGAKIVEESKTVVR